MRDVVATRNSRPPVVRRVAGEGPPPLRPSRAPAGELYLTTGTYVIFAPVLFFVAGAILAWLPWHPMNGPIPLSGWVHAAQRLYFLTPTGAHGR